LRYYKILNLTCKTLKLTSLHYFNKQFKQIYCFSYCDRPMSVVRRRAACGVRRRASTFLLQHLFLWNRSFEFYQIHRKELRVVLYQSSSNSQGQKIRFKKWNFQKNLLVYNYKAQSFHIWFITLSRGPLPTLFKLWSWGQNWPRTGGQNFTLNVYRKSLNDFFSWKG